MNNIAIIGAGGHTRSSLNLLNNHFEQSKFHIYDTSYNKNSHEVISDIPVCNKIEMIDTSSKVFVSIGDNKERAFYFNKFKKQLLTINLFHPTSIIENKTTFGISNQIFALAYINSHAIIGDDNIINTQAVIEHEVIIGNHNHISVGSKICGRSKIGDFCFFGAGSIVIDKINICDNVIIGAGAVVYKDIKESGTYIGNPLRKIK